MRSSSKVVLLAATLGLAIACVRVPATLAPSSTPLEGRAYDLIGPASATTRQSFILGIIPVQSEPELLSRTVESAYKQAGGDALIDVTVETMRRDYVIFSTLTTEVHGKAIKFKDCK
jgi:hypothetical protein